jgi:hypothetical protein
MSTTDTKADEITALGTRIKTAHSQVVEAHNNVLRKAKDVGDLLIEAKKKFGEHGKWLAFLKDNCALPERTAQRYMHLARGWSILEKKLTTEIRHTMADLSLNKAIDIIRVGEMCTTANDNITNIDGGETAAAAETTTAAASRGDVTLDNLDTRVGGVIKGLDKVNKKCGVDQAISEVSKIIEMLEAKMAEFSSLKTKQDLAAMKQKKAA